MNTVPPSLTAPLPTLFVSHGSPMMALEPGRTGPSLMEHGRHIAARYALKGVVIMSPHWMTDGLSVMGHSSPPTWHDFGGFPEPLYRLQYPAPGSPVLALRVQAMLAQSGFDASVDPERPFDHGAWMPMRFLLPEARVPVVQLSLPAEAGPEEVYAIGAALRGLRHEGVWLIGSGSMTHNLREFFSGRPAQAAPAEPYVSAFAGWMASTLEGCDLPTALQYRFEAPDAARAHPTDEHLMPLYFALGAAGWGQPDGPTPDYLSREVMYGHLAMDSMAFA